MMDLWVNWNPTVGTAVALVLAVLIPISIRYWRRRGESPSSAGVASAAADGVRRIALHEVVNERLQQWRKWVDYLKANVGVSQALFALSDGSVLAGDLEVCGVSLGEKSVRHLIRLIDGIHVDLGRPDSMAERFEKPLDRPPEDWIRRVSLKALFAPARENLRFVVGIPVANEAEVDTNDWLVAMTSSELSCVMSFSRSHFSQEDIRGLFLKQETPFDAFTSSFLHFEVQKSL